MSIIIENQTEFELNESNTRLIERTVEACVFHEECPYKVEVSITLVNNEEIKLLNKEYRDIDQETDVLSFPLIDFESPGLFDDLDENELSDLFNLDTNELMLGDIVVSIEKAKAQAQEYGHSMERELGFLIVHSMLHLFGYDHMDDAQEKEMFEIQEFILNKVGLNR